MTLKLTGWRGLVGRAVLVAAAATLVPLPVLAAGDGAAAHGKTPVKSLRQIAAAEAARTPLRASSAGRSTRQTEQKGSFAFFKTPTGMLILGVMAVGTGYAIYSASHDKVTSPAKK